MSRIRGEKLFRSRRIFFRFLGMCLAGIVASLPTEGALIEVFRADFNSGCSALHASGTNTSVVNGALEIDFENRGSRTSFNNLASPITGMESAGVIPESVIGAQLEFMISAPSGTTPTNLAASFANGDLIAGIVEIFDSNGGLITSTSSLGRLGSTPNISLNNAATFEPGDQPATASFTASFNIDFATDFPNGTHVRLNLVLREGGDGGTGAPASAGISGTDLILDDIVLKLDGTAVSAPAPAPDTGLTSMVEVFRADFSGGVNPLNPRDGTNVSVVNDALEVDLGNRGSGTSFNNLESPIFCLDTAGVYPNSVRGAEFEINVSAPATTAPAALAATFANSDYIFAYVEIFDDNGSSLGRLGQAGPNIALSNSSTFEAGVQPITASFTALFSINFPTDFPRGSKARFVLVLREAGDGGAGSPSAGGLNGTDFILDDLVLRLDAIPRPNLIANGSFEEPVYTGGQHLAPADWSIGGPANRGGFTSDSSRSSEGSQYVAMGGWTNNVGMELSQTVSLTSGEAYQLNFDAGVNFGTGEAGLLVEVFDGSNTPLSHEVVLDSVNGMRELQYQFLATSNQMTVRFTHTQGSSNIDLDLDNVRLFSAPLHVAQNGFLMIEAEDADPVGDWRQFPVRGITSLLFDSNQSSEVEPPVGQTLSYIFKTDEAATYHFALKSARILSATEGCFEYIQADTGNNDVWFALYNARTNQVIQNPIRHLTANWFDSNEWFKWGNLFPNNTASEIALSEDTEYRLELIGRGDGFALDRISIRSKAFRDNSGAFREPGALSEQTPKLPTPLKGSVDLSQYPDMEVWSRAGVVGGIPRGMPIVRAIVPGDDIQSAIDDVHNQGGGVLLLSNGTYEVPDTLNMKSNVTVRGEDRDAARIEFTYFGSVNNKSLFLFEDVTFSGVENLTMKYIAPDGLQPMMGVYNIPAVRNDIFTTLVHLPYSAENNWVKSCNILNSGTDPVAVDGRHNTMMDNYVRGAHNKHGGKGYYRVRGGNNLIKGEIVKDIRHFGILNRDPAQYNVIVDCFFNTDINFHLGDNGSNLFEGNTVSLPRWHFWNLISTGEIIFDHIPPGCGNIIVNNITHHAKSGNAQGWSQENLVHTFEGYFPPLATNIAVPEGGRFYVPVNPQLTFVNPTPSNRTVLDEGSSIQVEVQANVEIQSMSLYRDDDLVAVDTTAPYQWNITQGAFMLRNLSAGVYTFRVEANMVAGGMLEENFRITVDNSADMNKTIYGGGSYTYSGTSEINHSPRIDNIDDGDWLLFDNLRIVEAETISVVASSGDNNKGGLLEVRSGSPTGSLLGTVVIGQTGGPDNYEYFSANLTQAIDFPVDLYLVADGAGQDLYNLESFEFGNRFSDLDQTVEAESYDSQSDIQIIGGTKVGNIRNGDWISFSGLNVDSANFFSARVSSNTSGGTLEIREGSPAGTLLGSISIGNTGGWNVFEQLSTGITEVNGPADIYLVFTGGSGFLFDVDSFEFGSFSLAFISPTPPDNSVRGLGSAIRVAAQASKGVESMSLFINGLKVDRLFSPPYVWEQSIPGFPEIEEGSYTFRAEATLPGGGIFETFSSTIVVDMNGAQVGFSVASVMDNPDQIEISWAVPGLVLERSTDLLVWTAVAGESPIILTMESNVDQCFFRLRTD